MTRSFFTVFKKELLDAVRDKRSLLTIIGFSLMGPIMAGVMMLVVAEKTDKVTKVDITVVNASSAPQLVEFLTPKAYNIQYLDTFSTHEGMPENTHAVLVVPDNFMGHQHERKMQTVRIYGDAQVDKSDNAMRRLSRDLKQYEGFQAQGRLIEFGVSPAIINLLQVEEHELSATSNIAKKLSFMITFFLLIAPFVAGISTALDLTSSEREKGAFQALLSQPVNISGLVLAKSGTVASFGIASVFLSTAILFIILPFLPLENVGVQLISGPYELVMVMVVMTPFALLVSIMQTMLGLAAKSLKEGQTYISMLTMLPMVVFYATMINPDLPVDTIPVAGQLKMLESIMTGMPIALDTYAILTASTLAPVIIAFMLCVRFVKSERITSGG